MATLRVWVKGGPDAARLAAYLHGLTYDHEQTLPHCRWALGIVRGLQSDVDAWYRETPDRAPSDDGYADGTLLLWARP